MTFLYFGLVGATWASIWWSGLSPRSPAMLSPNEPHGYAASHRRTVHCGPGSSWRWTYWWSNPQLLKLVLDICHLHIWERAQTGVWGRETLAPPDGSTVLLGNFNTNVEGMWLQGLTCSAVKQSVFYLTSKIHPDFPNFLLQFAWLTRICNTARTLPLDWLTLFKKGVPESVLQLLGLKLLSPLGGYMTESWRGSISQTSDSKKKGAISGI